MRFISSLTSSKRRPIKRLIEYTVFSGFVTAWRFATCPTRRSPPLVIATTEGVVRAPSWLGITTGSPPCITATTELVVPRSIPIILLMSYFSSPKPCLKLFHRRAHPAHSKGPVQPEEVLAAQPATILCPQIAFTSPTLQVECLVVKMFDSVL